MAEKVKQKQIDQVDRPEKQKAVSEVPIPNLKNAFWFYLSISVGLHHILSAARFCNEFIDKEKQKEKQKDVKVDKGTKTDNNQQNSD